MLDTARKRPLVLIALLMSLAALIAGCREAVPRTPAGKIINQVGIHYSPSGNRLVHVTVSGNEMTVEVKGNTPQTAQDSAKVKHKFAEGLNWYMT